MTLSEMKAENTDEKLIWICLDHLDAVIADGDEQLILEVMKLFKERGCSVSYTIRLLELIGKIIPMLCPMDF